MFKRVPPSNGKVVTDLPSVKSKPGKSATSAVTGASVLIAERRKFIRPLPVPEVREVDTDSAWAKFDALSGEVSTDKAGSPSSNTE